jgi:proline dehydrogenase
LLAGATYGTGITAIKLTALGRPQLLLQLSEVIMRARKYMTEIVGGEGNVLSHHLTIQDLERKLSKIKDQESVKKFLTQITADKQG